MTTTNEDNPATAEPSNEPRTEHIHPRPNFPHNTEPAFTTFMWGFFTGVVTTVALATILSEEE